MTKPQNDNTDWFLVTFNFGRQNILGANYFPIYVFLTHFDFFCAQPVHSVAGNGWMAFLSLQATSTHNKC